MYSRFLSPTNMALPKSEFKFLFYIGTYINNLENTRTKFYISCKFYVQYCLEIPLDRSLPIRTWITSCS